jgi:serine/threonine protein kinase
MEYMSGGSLFDRLQRGALSTPEVVLVGHHVALALAAAHNVGVIHRDVKPHNILVGGFGQVKIGDFGIAAVVRESGQRTQTQARTLAYASPEELDGEEEVGVATDVYSLAATLGHLATGRKPSFRERLPLSLPMDAVPSLRAVGDALRAGMEIDPAMRPTMPQLADCISLC